MSDQSDETTWEGQKGQILKALIDTSNLCIELFDEVEAEKVRVSRERIGKISDVINRLSAVRQGMMLEYAVSGQATDDFLSQVRKDLRR